MIARSRELLVRIKGVVLVLSKEVMVGDCCWRTVRKSGGSSTLIRWEQCRRDFKEEYKELVLANKMSSPNTDPMSTGYGGCKSPVLVTRTSSIAFSQTAKIDDGPRDPAPDKAHWL